MRYLSSADLAKLLRPDALISAIELALTELGTEAVTIPARQHVSFSDGTLLIMPAVGTQRIGTKVISIVPSNADRGMPIANGLMILNDRATGKPIALFEAAALTAWRTGAVGAIGLKHTTPENIDRIGIIGIGVQGVWQAIFACAVRPVKTLCFVARSDEKAQHFVDTVRQHAPQVQFQRCTDAKQLLEQCKVIIAATASAVPVLPEDPELLEGRHFISIGSFKPSMQELPGGVYSLAVHVVVDSDAAKEEVGDLKNTLSNGLIREENIIHLADLVTGRHRLDRERTTAFKSVGMALYDLYAASVFLDEALKRNLGIELPS